MMESRNIETGVTTTTIWQKKQSLSYEFRKNYFIWSKRPRFTNFQIHLIEKWDTTSIRKEEKSHGHWLDSSNINGTRCYLKNGKLQIDEIFFNEFFDVKRDSNE
jgi:hypothetical protein